MGTGGQTVKGKNLVKRDSSHNRHLRHMATTLCQPIIREARTGTSNEKKGQLRLECDEMWSFVGKRQKKVWIWLALEKDTRRVVGIAFGKRDTTGAQALWDSLPAVYRQCAVCYTDFWEAYRTVLPSKRHKAVGKETGLTNHIERFNNTLRQIGRASCRERV